MNKLKKQKVITIDGPSASGKGTIARHVAQELNFDYLDSGALYRLTTLYAQQQGVKWNEEERIAQLAAALPVRFEQGLIVLTVVTHATQNVEDLIRTEEIGLGASVIAKLPLVRQALLFRQQEFLTDKGLVADGRDMGSIVFPMAFLKVFLTASVEVRAQRRILQLQNTGQKTTYQQVLQGLHKRDQSDQSREIAPLKKLPEAHLLDTSHLNVEESVQKVLQWYQQVRI